VGSRTGNRAGRIACLALEDEPTAATDPPGTRLVTPGSSAPSVALEQVSPGSTDAQLAVNGILLVIVAIRFPSGILGTRRTRP
jgi:hypothetical protein